MWSEPGGAIVQTTLKNVATPGPSGSVVVERILQIDCTALHLVV